MDTPPNSTLEDDIKQLLTEVPPPIRTFFASGKVEMAAKNLMQKNRLHIDQGAVVEREIILLLLGLKDPAEFNKALAEEAKLNQETITSIVRDVNDQIFVPLREQMMKSGTGNAPQPSTPQPPKAAVPSAIPRPPGNTPRPPMVPGAGGQPQRFMHLENKIPLPPRPAGQSGVAAIHHAPLTPPKPLENSKLLEDHEEPHIEFHKAPTPPIQPAPRVNAPPPNLPGAMPPRVTSEVRPSPTIPKVEPPAPPKPSAPLAPNRPYSVDPYREPIE
ncbi:hypothetical protein KGQ72_00540 [Patescibacteria group bacterium]|nr:hypothetical protein [Patescibacteria group bacterium]